VRVCWCGTPSLTRGRVYHLQLLLGLDRAVILGSESRVTHDHILLSQIPNSLNLEGQVPLFIPPSPVTGVELTQQLKQESKLLCGCRFTTNHFVFASNPLTPTTKDYSFQLRSYGNSLYVKSSLTRRWGLSPMNTLGLSSSDTYIAHIACYWKLLFFHYIQILC
jgi:hypothetical protein